MKNASVIKPVRCAVYGRKSHEEGLDQPFNSLDAQWEAGRSYVESQKHQGWILTPRRYEDGGFSGATIERPGLQALLAEVRAGQVDCIVAYKIDRLSRSLVDFAKLMEVFDKHKVTFVSVTQQFNTTTSMGRLTLHILLSFAQFEREVIGERIRDKIAASKKRGFYLGGVPPLGYDVDTEEKRLRINREEADRVRHIFRRFAQLKSTTKLTIELNQRGWMTKSWITKKGKNRPGRPWNKSHLYRLLNNPVYRGKIRHYDQLYDGQHDPIISKEEWEAVQRIFKIQSRQRGNQTRSQSDALLAGRVVCGECGLAMSPAYTRRPSRRYAYYQCLHTAKSPDSICAVRRIPMETLDRIAIQTVPERCLPQLLSDRDDGRIDDFLKRLKLLTPRHAQDWLSDLVVKATVYESKIVFDLAVRWWEPFAKEWGLETEADAVALTKLSKIEVAYVRRGRQKTRFSIDPKPFNANQPVVRSILLGYRLRYELQLGSYENLGSLAKMENLDPSYARRMINLTYLAPDLIEALLEGQAVAQKLTMEELMRIKTPIWEDQRKQLGISPEKTDNVMSPAR